MSYINKITAPFINTKVTSEGRKAIAKGDFSFSFFAFGDSEVDYRENVGENVLKPKDMNPNIKSFLLKSDCSPYNEITGDVLKVSECCVSSLIEHKGFFDTNHTLTDANIRLSYAKHQGYVYSQQMNFGLFLTLDTNNFDDGDFLLLKISNPQVGTLLPGETAKPVLYLWYKIKKQPAFSVAELDRPLPFLDYSNIIINYYIFSPDIEDYVVSNKQLLWDDKTLEFKTDCLVEDAKVWNMNIVYNEDFIGVTDTKEKYKNFDSYPYIGQKEYLGYNLSCPTTDVLDCNEVLFGKDDDFVRGIGIIHYSNSNIKNEYGEYLSINEHDRVDVTLPTIMWHGRYFSGTSTGNDLGMNFTSDTTKKYVDGTNIEYYDLIEDKSYIFSGRTANVVGRVYAQLKIITIHNPELLAVMSYKSNRNFSLPKLKGKMISTNGNVGFLPRNKRLYVTYLVESNDTILYSLPQQNYLIFDNTTSADKDVDFWLESVNMLPYMRKKESINYDGYGFFAHRFKVLYQITNLNERPNPTAWSMIDYTNNYLLGLVSNTITPTNLENQNPSITGFHLNLNKAEYATTYDINVLGYPDLNCPDILGFGDETFFFGNINAVAAACAYKNILELTLDEGDYEKSSNKTWNNNQLELSEIGVYDDNYNLLMIGKLSEPFKLPEGSLNLIEMTMDF